MGLRTHRTKDEMDGDTFSGAQMTKQGSDLLYGMYVIMSVCVSPCRWVCNAPGFDPSNELALLVGVSGFMCLLMYHQPATSTEEVELCFILL